MTAISKNLHIDKLPELVGKYKNTIHKLIKMKPVEVKPNTYIDFDNSINTKTNLMLVIM